jgi:hypothetical protein
MLLHNRPGKSERKLPSSPWAYSTRTARPSCPTGTSPRRSPALHHREDVPPAAALYGLRNTIFPNSNYNLLNHIPLPPANISRPQVVSNNQMTLMPSRIKTNRANSLHSTGPQTAAGKKRSSLNALSHGLTGKTVVMPTDDLQAYQAHLESFTDEYDPKGPTEAHLVQALADTSWRLNRVAGLETGLLSLPAEAQVKALANLSLYSQRLSRQFERTVAQLRDLQQIRRSQEHQSLDELLEVMDMFEANGETYDPAEDGKDDGFVFSESEIHDAIRRRNHEYLVEQARAA